MATYLLHGTLVVTIHDAENIVTQERKTGGAPAFIRKIIETSEEILRMGKGYSQYYATVDLGRTRVGRTRVLEGEPKDPVWNETFRIYCAHMVSELTVSIKDAAIVGTVVVGRAKVPAIDLLSGRRLDQVQKLFYERTELNRARIRFSLQFFSASGSPSWGRGLGEGFPGVDYCYFPQRNNCRVTLYQDAHMPDHFLPPIYLANGQLYQPTRCWEDVFEAINGAQQLVYITGWSVYTEIKLCRDPNRQVPGDDGLTLGELLKRKADQGVRVNLLVWDDRSSFWLNQQGQMHTHDEATSLYFRNTKVNCYLCPRNPPTTLTFLQQAQIGNLFTHHQKSVIVDAPLRLVGPGGTHHPHPARRVIVSFVGGLDLCDGRYDTQFHSLFRTLGVGGAHRDDLHLPEFTEGSLACGGPREPWHDVHARLEGPVAWDVLYNFEQRWRKQAVGGIAGVGGMGRMLVDVVAAGLGPITATGEDDPDTWNAQLFRSIDAGAADGFPSTPEAAAQQGLISGKDTTLDRSLQHAYIDAIRRARHFIYIENQYFIGSSFAWDDKQDAGAFNLIPIELVRKIVSKIEAGERFCVYVVMPLYPEGIPDSVPVQEILAWQRRTFQMMYREIAEAFRVKRVYDQHPRDYLTVFCLGNRETARRWTGGGGGEEEEYVPTREPTEAYYRAAQEKRRFMIYVHSKMMIVDDEYIILGSANINERSMDGARDTEIAMGGYQPYHLASHRPASGQIHGFRMALWFEHTGFLHNSFLQPWSLECTRTLNQRGDELWALFTQDAVVDLPGHLLTYPFSVGLDGSLTEVRGSECFPDTKAKVLGSSTLALPDILTT